MPRAGRRLLTRAAPTDAGKPDQRNGSQLPATPTLDPSSARHAGDAPVIGFVVGLVAGIVIGAVVAGGWRLVQAFRDVGP